LPLLHLLVLALIQGITEFLPISSSGHLVLTWELLGSEAAVQDQLTIDIAVHVGTLAAVCAYFRGDLAAVAGGVLGGLRGRPTAGTRLAGHLLIATLPLVAVGLAFHQQIEQLLRDPLVIAWATVIFALALYAADKAGATRRRLDGMGTGHALVYGLLQVLALIPGTSRSGITMTAGRLLGYDRREAARFAMLLAIPAILGAGLFAARDLYDRGAVALGLDALLAAAMAALAAWLAIALLMRWLQHASFTPFVIYRLLLGGVLLALIYGGWMGAPAS
jgi:undecaprenyl-diphosphatase